MKEKLSAAIDRITTEVKLTAEVKEVFYYAPVAFDLDCVAAVRRAAERLGYSHRDIVSGAGHDACYIARLAPTSMVFCPCVDGISHNEAEDISPEWASAGADVLFHAVVETAEIVA
jgi:N-carbamoyl-L-amino-acid hydrolase